MSEDIEAVSLIDFRRVFQSAVDMGNPNHLWDWLNYNAHIKTMSDEDA